MRGGEPSIDSKLLEFKIDSTDNIVFGPQINDVNVSAPQSIVSVGFGSEAVLVAPVYIEAKSLVIEAKQMVVKRPSKAAKHVYDEMSVVQLLADETASDLSKPPVLRGNVSLKVSWPGAESFPWTNYAFSMSDKKYDSRTKEALRRLRKILSLFRSHGKNQLAKFRDAIDHRRRTQGVGSLVLEQLIRKNVLTRSDRMYFLDSTRLDEVTGLKLKDIRSGEVPLKTIDFVQKALQDN